MCTCTYSNQIPVYLLLFQLLAFMFLSKAYSVTTTKDQTKKTPKFWSSILLYSYRMKKSWNHNVMQFLFRFLPKTNLHTLAWICYLLLLQVILWIVVAKETAAIAYFLLCLSHAHSFSNTVCSVSQFPLGYWCFSPPHFFIDLREWESDCENKITVRLPDRCATWKTKSRLFWKVVRLQGNWVLLSCFGLTKIGFACARIKFYPIRWLNYIYILL